MSHKKHTKITLKHTPKWPKMAPFWSLGATLEPWCHQGHKMCTNLAPKGPPKRPIWSPMGTLKANRSSKFDSKYCKSKDSKTQHEKVTIQDPPKPQKVSFYLSKTDVFKDPPYPEKVTKMTPKGTPNGSQIDPNSPKGPSRASPNPSRTRTRNKDPKKTKKKKLS